MKILSNSLMFVAVLVLPASSLFAQGVNLKNSPGLVTFTGKTNYASLMASGGANTTTAPRQPEADNAFPMLRPPVKNAGQAVSQHNVATPIVNGASPDSTVTPLVRGFTGLRHLDSRTARNGNQFSITPPDQAIAVGNGFVLEAVNCVLAVYDKNGDLIVPAAAANTQPMALTTFFGIPAAINRTTGVQNNNPGDVVALYDPESQHWFVEAWAQDVKPVGTGKNTSKIYLAVSQTSDPTGSWFQYTITFTGLIPDYAKIGLDHNGLYISANDFGLVNIGGGVFVPDGLIGAELIVVQKSALITGGAANVAAATLPFGSFGGYEFTILPQMAPPGTAYLTSNGGTMYFASSQFVFNTECTLGVWSITNTNAINVGGVLLLQFASVNTECFNFPSQAVLQQPGFTPEATAVGAALDQLDPGDFRMGGQNIVFTNSQLFCTLATEVTDSFGNQVMGAAWFALHPTITGGTLGATLSQQGIISLNGASFLRPAVAMNTQLFGAVVGTQVGVSDFPSSAIVGFNGFIPGGVQITRAGNEPADDFSGYPAFGGAGVSRWGDYSATAIDDADNALWTGTEYTPDINRTTLTNWATYVSRVQLNH